MPGPVVVAAAYPPIGTVVLAIEIGYALGIGLISWYDNRRFNKHRKEDLDKQFKSSFWLNQHSSFGLPITYTFGRDRITGNLIGGGELTETLGVWSATFDLSYGEGPIDGIKDLWFNGEKAFDVTADPGYIATGWPTTDPTTYQLQGSYAGHYVYLYRGTETQTADSRMETVYGAGNVPGYRGLIHLVFDEYPLTRFNDIIPTVSVTIVRNYAQLIAQYKISDIIATVCERMGLDETQYDITALEDIAWPLVGCPMVYGYTISGETGIDALGNIMDAFFIDGVETL